MKIKLLSLVLLLAAILIFTSCAKGTLNEDGSERFPTDDTSSESATSSDEINYEHKNAFVSWDVYTNVNRVAKRASDATSLKLSKVNRPVAAEENGAFTSAYGETIKSDGQDYANYAVAVFEYDHSKFSYIQIHFADVGKASAETAIPKDGFVVAIWKDNTAKINAIKAASGEIAFFPHGFVASNGLDAKIKSAKSTPIIDGKVSTDEYGNVVWEIKPTNDLASYIQFEVNSYNATAEVYMTYDASNLYIGVIVDTPMHYNDCDADYATQMYKYDCIQLNLSAFAENSEYIRENWDHVINPTAVYNNAVRQYGFSVNESGETISCIWLPSGDESYKHKACCVRDNVLGKTYYEVAIGWDALGTSEFPIEPPVKGDKIGVSVAINCSDENNQIKSLYLRDGGGIIGINDWSKIPTITLD